MDLVQLGGRVGGSTGPRFWRSLEEYAETEEFRAFLRDEFPSQIAVWEDPVGRRHFLKLMGASLALAGLSGCAFQPPEDIVPYVKAPDDVVPGKPVFYASALALDGYATGVLVESHLGRPTKIEGNPDHPASLGATDLFGQAEILTFYDPDRSKVVQLNGRVSTWENFLEEMISLRISKLASKGEGLRLLTSTITSPSLADQIQTLLKEFPEARWHQYESVGRANTRAGAKLAFGEDVDPIHHLDKADVVLALDADFLSWGPSRLVDARRWAERRDPPYGTDPATWSNTCNRLYAVESTPTITGAVADHRLAVRSSEVAGVLRALAQELGVAATGTPNENHAEWIKALAADLKTHSGTSLVLVGEPQPPQVHALAHAINQALGNIGQTVEFIEPVAFDGGEQSATLAELVRDMQDDKVDALLILGGNPAYDAPADFAFDKALDKVRTAVHLSLYEDETSALCRWHIPQTHVLETWGDVRAYDGTVTIQQPLILPIFNGRSAIEVVSAMLGGTTVSDREVVRRYWEKRGLGSNFQAGWRKALHAGVVADTASKPKAVTLQAGPFGIDAETEAQVDSTGYEVVFRPDPSIWDGRYANNGWLQELPKQITRLTWDNAALMSPATADKLQVRVNPLEMTGNVVEVSLPDRKGSLRLPVWITPGHPDNAVTIHLGYGRAKAGRVGDGQGFNAYTLRTSTALWFKGGAQIRKVEGSYRLATTQHHQNIGEDSSLGVNLNEERHLIRYATLDDFVKHPDFAHEPDHHVSPAFDLYPESPEPRLSHDRGERNSWAMAININTCIGCNACVVACQAENNIPVVGKNEVLKSRNMHWLRIDRYYEGRPDDPSPRTHFQPVPCMHCEKAPCETVCPVAATVHDAEGLNTMVYNRCVGTRYCANNCPYKVRRFNFLQYSDETTESFKLMRNPDVTIRSRGVMEKCTYCVQRLWAAKINAQKQGRDMVLDGEVVTACQGACPTRAITFGNKNDKNSAIAKAIQDGRNYVLLAELNTKPRTSYLAKLINPNPEIKES
jgi:molybdopterin-containing oxidoreductase family iron-sulfur binding subunit